ncbi:uncharacterized protein DUF3570 [Neolewinella xylanilytica]|uniref:Uncharacterized protein DUF3570 n=1 Tax=Neolewinella xylanilytica TaxID=1514080 RepID=A0A2S6I4U7_9BACT|nr:DUF3570 domain-containing protein [Neolewinella xylanilytica]PPK86203.1 uncharacterized protein DUF3570 [Neolewinella xylanilytica]
MLCSCAAFAQEVTPPTAETYKKRVLEAAELQVLTSYYQQDGDNAAVTGGRGTEKLTDVHPTVILALPLNADDVLTASFGVSAYTSASSSNVDPFDGGGGEPSPFQASSGASGSDVWINGTVTYAHSSDDRNNIVSGTLSFSNEYDYRSFGFGGSFTRLMNEQNTELTVHGSAYLDNWKIIYPIELRGRDDLLDESGRNSYNLGLNLSQLLSRKAQGMLSVDLVRQEGLLSTPFQRVYFADIAETVVGGNDFYLAQDIERLPDIRNKLALGGRLHYYLSQRLVLRSFYRFYTDDWAVNSHTVNLELPVNIGSYFSITPGYRYYTQRAAEYFAGFDEHLSSETFYTSDYDLSTFQANQFSLGIGYLDILADRGLLGWGLKSVDLNYSRYRRDNGFHANQVALGLRMVRQ